MLCGLSDSFSPFFRDVVGDIIDQLEFIASSVLDPLKKISEALDI